MNNTGIKDNKSINSIDSITNMAFNLRLKSPALTIKYATTAFSLAKKTNYLNGLGEACRVIGIGESYLNNYEKALDKYLEAILYFEQTHNFNAIGKVYNNIGNLYLSSDYDKALEYYTKALQIAKKYQAKPEIARLYVNIGIVEMKKKNFSEALEKFQLSTQLFKEINAPDLIVTCMQNQGEAYNYLKQYQKAETILQEAFTKAQALNLNVTIANINLTLSNVYLNQSKFDKAEKTLTNGFEYARNLDNRDLQNDYNYAFYQLAYKKGDYKTALGYLKQNFSQDSAYYRQSFSKRITLASDLFVQLENRTKNERIIAQQKYATTLFWSSATVAALLAALVCLLIINIKRTNRSNTELTRLNIEVSKQKEHADLLNRYLEEKIDERTKDLKVKNKRLSEYSLHLSHQIRGPIATLKGIVYLQENSMIDQEECIDLIKKCVFNIDEEIISMSKTLNDNHGLNPDKI
ncbi:tetratricopeptide repeat protein [Mucilaginibacter arboris]|uniref:Tetratricopeptide repeat protein n=1 Tax=Mucilaginibacter arboris TaxID=2682090 RepID=A0A7K1SSP8_9SPHI|nr:tetratricopeptide repeat protein [Mucilaginibacter arboris]MVN20325.1 tetratricopeptide repeat protein [Mucilaginibacter arboris]